MLACCYVLWNFEFSMTTLSTVWEFLFFVKKFLLMKMVEQASLMDLNHNPFRNSQNENFTSVNVISYPSFVFDISLIFFCFLFYCSQVSIVQNKKNSNNRIVVHPSSIHHRHQELRVELSSASEYKVVCLMTGTFQAKSNIDEIIQLNTQNYDEQANENVKAKWVEL